MDRKKKKQKQPLPPGRATPAQVDEARRQRNLREMRDLMNMNRSGLT